MQSTVKHSYSFSVFQVSPTQSIQAQRTLSRHSDCGGASKHPNNYSGSHMISRWLSSQANRGALHVDKTILPQGKMHMTFFLQIHSTRGTFSANRLLFHLSNFPGFAVDMSVGLCACIFILILSSLLSLSVLNIIRNRI